MTQSSEKCRVVVFYLESSISDYFIFENVPIKNFKMMINDNGSQGEGISEDSEGQRFVNEELLTNLKKFGGMSVDCKEFCKEEYDSYKLFIYEFIA